MDDVILLPERRKPPPPSGVRHESVYAAGGIASGRAMLAAMALGAEGIQAGTLFALTEESSASPAFKQRCTQMAEGDTMLCLKALSPTRLVKNALYHQLINIARYIIHQWPLMAIDKQVYIHPPGIQSTEQTKKLKQQMSNNITHELRTPVSSIRGYLETIMECAGLNEQRKDDFLRKAHAQAVRLTDLISRPWHRFP